MKRNPVLAAMSTLAGLQFIVGGAMTQNLVSKQVGATMLLLVAGVQLGVQFYVRGQVTPTDNVVAQTTTAGVIVAGPAAQTTTGAPVAEPEALEVQLVAEQPAADGAGDPAAAELDVDDPPAMLVPPGADGIAIKAVPQPAKKRARRPRG